MRKPLIIKFVVLFFILACQPNAHPSFIVNWGNSWDPGNGPGYEFIANWLVNNGYFTNLNDAKNFAQFEYIGHKPTDPDPFHWNLPQGAIVEIVQEISAYKNITTFGFYEGGGGSKTLTQIFNATQNGPTTIFPAGNFGFYINSPYGGGVFWFTGRSENLTTQSGTYAVNSGGDPQSVIYELSQNEKWLIAWEDLDSTGSSTDNDYQDMFVTVTAIPEPNSAALLLLGLISLLLYNLTKIPKAALKRYPLNA